MKKAGQIHAISWLMLLQIMATSSILTPSGIIEWEKQHSALTHPTLTTNWIEEATSRYLAEPLSWDPNARSSTSIFDTPQHFSEPQEPHPLSIPYHGLLSCGDAYPGTEIPLDAGFVHSEGNSRAFGDHNHHPLRVEKGNLASSPSIHRHDAPLPSIEPQVGEGGQVKSSSQRKRKSPSDTTGSLMQPGTTDNSQLTEVPQDANIHSSPQRKRKFQSKIQQISVQPGMTSQSELTEVSQHAEGAVETQNELHGNESNSDQERAPATPGPPHTTKAQVKREKSLARSKWKQANARNRKEAYEILDLTDRTLGLNRYPIFSNKIMGRINVRLNSWQAPGEIFQRPWLKAESVKRNVENITKISTYLILKDISVLKTGKEEIITDKEEIEEVLLFMDIFWQKLFAGTLKLPGEFTWIPRLAFRMDPKQFGARNKHRRGAYFWMVTSKEIKDVWLASFGNFSP